MKCYYYKRKKTGKSGMLQINSLFSSIFCLLVMASSCTQTGDYSPKPRGHFRIDFPEKAYQPIAAGCPFSFEIPAYSKLQEDLSPGAKPCWKNLDFPAYNARLHISYIPINEQAPLSQLTEDARTFAFKHTAKATAIDQSKINIPSKNIYGLTYYIRGNTASNLQFFVSDSSKNYLRAALYFNEKPNIDSIQPVLEFIRADVEHIISSFSWK